MPNEQGHKPVLHKKHVARLQREQQQGRIILYTFFSILAAVVLLLIYGWLDINYFQSLRPVAKVGEVEILVRDFEPRVRLQRQQLLSQYSLYSQYQQFGMNVDAQLQQIQASLDDPATLGQTVLERMITEELIRQEAAKRGITASEEEIKAELEAAFEYFPSGTPTPTITPTEAVLKNNPADVVAVTFTPGPTATLQFTPTLEPLAATATVTIQAVDGTPTDGTPVEPSATASLIPTATIEPTITPTTGPTSTVTPTATPYTLEGFEKQVSDAGDRMVKLGFEENIYRKFFEAQILEKKLREVIGADAVPSDTEEEQVRARHILVDDFEIASGLIERLKNGEDFAALAREFSTDTGSGEAGGDLGWFGRGAMVPEFEVAAYALKKPGDFTDAPVQSNFGYHIIQLMDRAFSPEQLQAVKDTAFSDWLTAAREEYGVEIFDIWLTHIPSEPNFITIATDAANAQSTAQAEALKALEGTATPKP
jgi:parvulin-like peptidyl-prolyl isomerase